MMEWSKGWDGLASNEGISTSELWARLFKAPTIGSYLDSQGDAELPSFSDYLSQLADERNLKREVIISRAGLERTFGHRLFNGTRNPSRDTVLQLAFGLCLNTDETQQLLKIARVSPLHPKVKRDAIIAYCLHNCRSLMETQQVLYEHDMSLLGGTRRG